MRFLRSMLGSLILLAVVMPVVAEDEQADPRETLKSAIPEGIRLLSAKEYTGFLKSFVAPDDLKKITERKSMEEFAKRFGERKAGRLLEVLKEIKSGTPELDAAGTTATFQLKEAVGGKGTIKFVKVKKYWYIKN